MKTDFLSTLALIGTLGIVLPQETSGQANPVISSPQPTGGTPASSGTQPSTGGKFGTAVENFLDKFLKRDQVSLDQLPAPAQSTVRNEVGTYPIQTIKEVNSNGQTSYVVTYDRNGQKTDLQVDASGRVLNGGQATTGGQVISSGPISPISSPREPLSSPVPVGFYQLPSAVQSTLQQYAQGGSIDNIESGMVQGQTVYQATLNNNGRSTELRVDQNGSLVRDPVNDQYLSSTGRMPMGNVIGRPTLGSRDWRNAPVRQPLEQSTAADLQSVPPAVRNTFLTYAAGGGIESVEQGLAGGQTIYEARVRPNGQLITLRASENGSLIDDQVNDRFLSQFSPGPGRTSVGQAPTWQTGNGSYNGNTLSSMTPVSYNQLPLAVQTTIDAQANGAPLGRIAQGTLNGRPVYEVSFTQNGQPTMMRVAEDGSVLSAPWTR